MENGKRIIYTFFSSNLALCCGSERFLTGSDFRKRPDLVPDLDQNLSRQIFLWKFYFAEICSKPKSYTTEIPEVFMAFTHTKKVDLELFIKGRIRIRQDPNPQHWNLVYPNNKNPILKKL
jgi:hypothetical protein